MVFTFYFEEIKLSKNWGHSIPHLHLISPVIAPEKVSTGSTVLQWNSVNKSSRLLHPICLERNRLEHFRKRRLLKPPRIKSKTGCPEVDLLTEFHNSNTFWEVFILRTCVELANILLFLTKYTENWPFLLTFTELKIIISIMNADFPDRQRNAVRGKIWTNL